MPRRMTRDEFIIEATKLFGDRYDYSFVDYINQKTKVLITCKKHNTKFLQSPEKHLKSQLSCPVCKSNALSDAKRGNTDDFIRKAKSLYGELFDYSLVEYTKTTDKVKIICRKHGVFEQIAGYHLSGCKGCHTCWNNSRSAHISKLGKKYNKPFKTTEQFIKEAMEVHGDAYSYDSTVYKGNNELVEIICKEHGSFWQSASNHLARHGCSACCSTGFDRAKDAVLYIYNIKGTANFTGFGITGNYSIRKRSHLTNLSKHGAVLEDEYLTEKFAGDFIVGIETLLKQTFPLAECSKDIPGFKTESTVTPYHEVVSFVQDYINNNKEATWLH